jgi:hypothetical protein
MTRRQIVAAYWLVLLLFGATALVAFHQGKQRGLELGIRQANSSEGVAAGIHAVELVGALNAGRTRDVRRGLDLMIDSAIATHYLRLQAPDAMGGPPDPTLQWRYAHLLEHRRHSRSTSQTKHIGTQVAAALGRPL